jgi:hypothetical protein
MADLIAKVSRSSTKRTDLSQVYSNALASGHHDAQFAFPRPAKFSDKNPYNTFSSSDVELDDILYGREFAPGGALDINMKSEIHVRVERIDSAGASTKEGSELGNTVSPMEEDTKPLTEEDMEREAKQHAQRTGVEKGMGVHTKAWGSSSEGGRC